MTSMLDYRTFRLCCPQIQSDMILTLTYSQDLLEQILSWEEEIVAPTIINIRGYSWRQPSSFTTYFKIRRRVDMASALSCTCKTMFNNIQYYMNPSGLTIVRRGKLLNKEFTERWYRLRGTSVPNSKIPTIDLCSVSDSETHMSISDSD